jgi:hypothetical protein
MSRWGSAMSDDATTPGVETSGDAVPMVRGVRLATVGDVSRDLLRILPSSFVGGYEDLVLRCFPVLRGASDRDPDAAVSDGRPLRVRTSTGQTETRGGAHNARRSGLNTRDPLGSERAIRLRAKVDRKLRALAREMSADVTRRDQLRRCTRCRTFADAEWNFCPRDGAPTEQVD